MEDEERQHEMLGRYAWALTPADFPQVRFDLNY